MVRSIRTAATALLAPLVAPVLATGLASSPAAAGWELERGVAEPSYAVTQPLRSELNVDTVVLTCEQGPQRRGLQLRLYLTGDGPLAPLAAATPAADTGSEPALALSIDGAPHTASVYFADDFVVLADAADGFLPLLSRPLLDALESGRRLDLGFAFGTAQAGAVIDLEGGAAIAAVRRCGQDDEPQLAGRPGRF